MSKFEDVQENVLNWADKKNLLVEKNSRKQFMKFIEEVFEFKEEMDTLLNCRSYIKENPKKVPWEEHERLIENAMLEMGDIFVTLIILCDQLKMHPQKCLDMAYEKIKDRKGKTINGLFVKEEDL